MKLAMLLIFIFSYPVLANQRISTASVQDFSDFAFKKKSDIPAARILLVYDFDNTLMAMNQDLGSDQWFRWQTKLILEKKFKDAVAHSPAELFEVATKIYALGRMHMVEKGTATVVRSLQSAGFKNLVLTKRGSSLRADIDSELEVTGMNFKEGALGPEGGYPGAFQFAETSRSVSYMDGILMGGGQNKGKLLRELLKKTKSEIQLVVFLDDTLSNIEDMEKEFSKDGPEMITFFYTHEEPRVQSFERDQSQAKKAWKQLAPVLKSVFPEPN